MNDPLAPYRKKPLVETTLPAGGDEYIAFAAKDRMERLKIKCANQPTHAPGYGYLLEILYDGTYGTNFVLVYTILGVKVTGRNLQPVIMALLAGTADYIQEFDRDKWPKPTDAKTPFIESIEIVVQDNAKAAATPGKIICAARPSRSITPLSCPWPKASVSGSDFF
jgi:hypothetical protein